MNARMTLWVALIAPLLTHQVMAEPDHGKGQQQKDKAAQKQLKKDPHKAEEWQGIRVEAGISLSDVRALAQRYNMTGQSALPPGIRKNLARGKPLPPGIAKKAVPAAMLAELPKHQGYEWQVVGTDIVLVSIATAVISDILLDVLN